jgi:hypothetical protein
MYKYVLNNSSANRLEKLLGDYVAHPDDKKSLSGTASVPEWKYTVLHRDN